MPDSGKFDLEKNPRAGKTRTSDVKEILLDWIRQGKYPPGSQLPTVPDLVNRLEVSRTVVREALQTLAGMNLIEIRAGLGCYVRSIPSNLIVNADVMAALIDMDTLIEVAIARKAIEGSVARLAALDANADDFENIEIALDRIQRCARKNQPMYSVTPDFHVAVAQATHNAVLRSVVSSFNLLMVAAGEVIERDEVGYTYRIGEYESHLELYGVIRKGDPDRAQAAMQEHIQKTVDALQIARARSKQPARIARPAEPSGKRLDKANR
jgi:GntR family transcriptional repressor for pyruvate dehydrogenase complex